MDEKIYQNIDHPKDNPDYIPTTSEKPLTNSQTKDKIKLTPKIILLLVLAFIILSLSITALIVTRNRQQNTNITPNPTPIVPVLDDSTKLNDSLIPTQYQDAFNEINQDLEFQLDLPVPQIDTKVGL
ncbi:hypothetical protein KBB92_01595 [Candidatus Shapirobacteria bacterium]|nr:hypothetical protein [Candidatus Shapirobacteria bacterium]HQI13476.1 hypothetical protein [Candidatus Woesebacteria bacterium]